MRARVRPFICLANCSHHNCLHVFCASFVPLGMKSAKWCGVSLTWQSPAGAPFVDCVGLLFAVVLVMTRVSFRFVGRGWVVRRRRRRVVVGFSRGVLLVRLLLARWPFVTIGVVGLFGCLSLLLAKSLHISSSRAVPWWTRSCRLWDRFFVRALWLVVDLCVDVVVPSFGLVVLVSDLPCTRQPHRDSN